MSDGAPALNREAAKAFTPMFRIIEVNEKDGFVPQRLKGYGDNYRDPRSMREWAIPVKVVYAYVVTPDGRVVEPRVLRSTDDRVAKYLTRLVFCRRFVPAKFRGAPVYALGIVEFSVAGHEPQDSGLGRDGLGLETGDR